jgi:hypothetical protein
MTAPKKPKTDLTTSPAALVRGATTTPATVAATSATVMRPDQVALSLIVPALPLRLPFLERCDFSSSRHPAPALWWSMIISDLASPAEAGFAKAGNGYPLFGIML